jgi:hypothetical protein
MENDRPEHSPRLLGLMMDMGYRCYWHTPPLCEKDNWLGCPNNLFPGIAAVNILGVPDELVDSPIPDGLVQVQSPDDPLPIKERQEIPWDRL